MHLAILPCLISTYFTLSSHLIVYPSQLLPDPTEEGGVTALPKIYNTSRFVVQCTFRCSRSRPGKLWHPGHFDTPQGPPSSFEGCRFTVHLGWKNCGASKSKNLETEDQPSRIKVRSPIWWGSTIHTFPFFHDLSQELGHVPNGTTRCPSQPPPKVLSQWLRWAQSTFAISYVANQLISVTTTKPHMIFSESWIWNLSS